MQRWGRGIQDDSSLGNGTEVLVSLASYCLETQILNLQSLGFVFPM